MSKFDEAFELVVGIEAGYVDDPDDPGGETKYGVSKRAYPNEDIKNMTLDRAKLLFKCDYWDKCRCDDIPSPLDTYVFDAAVNQGVGAAIRLLQNVLGVVVDGKIGPKTIAAAQKADDEDMALYMVARAFRYIETGTFWKHGKGWFKRLFLVTRGA
jgi:lysozyme family protein